MGRAVGALVLACVLATLPARAGDPPRPLDAGERALIGVLQARAPAMRAQLERWVAINTGSENVDGLAELARVLVAELRPLGFEVEWNEGVAVDYPGWGERRTGPVLVARRPGPEGGMRFLLSGHMDTVFEPDSSFQRLGPTDPTGRALGPGAADMKGGLVVMLRALEALRDAGELRRASWTVVLNSDEELGSLGSRPILIREAGRADLGFVFESARPDGTMVRSRRGLGQFLVRVEGVSAHAGSAHAKGRSAIVELAQKVLEIERWTDYERGLTLNAGLFRGGTKRNIVPGHAEAWIDLRYEEPSQGREVQARLEALAQTVHVPGTRTSVWGVLHRPPKPSTAETLRLLALHGGIAAQLGVEPTEPVHAGGGTDGSLMADAGLPTLDSMGVRGGEAHTPREFILVDSLAERAAIAAILFRRLLDPEWAAGL